MEKDPTATVRWAVIANPAAARGRAPRLAAAASQFLKERGIQTELLVSESRGHACELAGKAVAEGAGRIVVCGGDGTLNEILPAVAGSPAAVGLLPCGTANDFARALGIPRRPRPALFNLVEGREVRVDLGVCGDRYFCTVAACGFDAEVSEAMREGRRLPGTAGYLWAALRHLFRFEPAKVAATGDFGRLETEVLLIAAAVTQSYGGGMRIAPHADPADGRFDVVNRRVGRQENGGWPCSPAYSGADISGIPRCASSAPPSSRSRPRAGPGRSTPTASPWEAPRLPWAPRRARSAAIVPRRSTGEVPQ